MQRSTLMRHVDPRGRTAMRFEEGLEPVEIDVGKHNASPIRMHEMSLALRSTQAMVARLLDTPEIKGIALLRRQDRPITSE